MKVLVTGANGFIGKNLMVYLRERPSIETTTFVRGESSEELAAKVASADIVFHLAGVNRPQNDAEFTTGNADLTRMLCEAIKNSGRAVRVVYASSIQAELDNAYGSSKRAAEDALREMADATGVNLSIFRLPNVFGKWCRPNYNSAVATFCHNIAHDLPIQVNDRNTVVRLVHVADVCEAFLARLDGKAGVQVFEDVTPIYETTLGSIVDQLQAFKRSRSTMLTERVGTGFPRALYSTYISYFTPEQFAYPLVKHEDPRGVFVEMLKTYDSGQFSFFTAHPGITRGGHYHHTKNEKFLVIKGAARFCFRHVDTGDTYEYCTAAAVPEVVETVPGWSHDITNIGEEEMIVMLWANEVFDREHPDTINYKVHA